MQNFDLAVRLAALAVEADEIDKTALSPHELLQLQLCIDVMHFTAQTAASDRIGELYADDAGLDELRAMLAGTQAAGLPGYLDTQRLAA